MVEADLGSSAPLGCENFQNVWNVFVSCRDCSRVNVSSFRGKQGLKKAGHVEQLGDVSSHQLGGQLTQKSRGADGV